MLSDWGHWLISRIMGGLTFYFCPYKTIAVRFCGRTGHVYKIESSLPLKPPPTVDSRTNGMMSKSRLWIALTFLLVPTTTCHGSDCQPLTCTVIQGLGQASDRAVIEGWMSVPPREKQNCSDTFPRQHLEFTHLKNSHVQLMSIPRPFGGANCNPPLGHFIIRLSMKALNGAWYRRAYGVSLTDLIYIVMEGWRWWWNSVSARTVTLSSYDVCTLDFINSKEQLVNIKMYITLTSMNEYKLNTMISLF